MMAARPVVLAVLCLGMSGCWFFKKQPPRISAPATQPATAQPVTTQAAPPTLATAPEPAPPPVVQNAVPAATPTPKETPTPKPAVRRNPVPAPPPPAPAAVPVAPVAPPPPLREIISGEQRRQYEAEFSKGIARASAAMKQASTRTLNASQQETVARIRTFLAQADAMRDNDISTALQLARRADLLGQDLLRSLK